MTRIDPYRMARSALLLGLGVLIAKLLLTGQMRYYMTPSLDPLTALTGVLLAGMGALELRQAVHGRRSPARTPGELDVVLTFGLVAVPLVLGLTFVPRALGSTAVGGTPLSRLVLAFDSAEPSPSTGAPAPRRPIADVADLLDYLRQAGENGVGQHVHVRGLVARGDDVAANEFVLLRYSIVHCVADAQPLGILVLAPHDDRWSSQQWVEIDGTLASTQRGGDRLISIRAEHILPSEEPSDPYVPAF